MPNRIIEESLNKLSWFEEVVFYRLIVRMDDHGRIDARPKFLISMLFDTKQGVTEKSIADAVSKLISLELIRCYQIVGKPFLLLPKKDLHRRIRDYFKHFYFVSSYN